jgi:hypothetical protein
MPLARPGFEDVVDVSSAKRGYSFVGNRSRKDFASLREPFVQGPRGSGVGGRAGVVVTAGGERFTRARGAPDVST